MIVMASLDSVTSDAPWPYLTCKQAAKRLGVSTETVQRLADGGAIQNVQRSGRSGSVVYLLRTSTVDALVLKMASDG